MIGMIIILSGALLFASLLTLYVRLQDRKLAKK